MVNYTGLVSQLFAAYGRDATEEFIRAYVTVFKTAKPEFLAKAIIEATTKQFDKLPTAMQLVRLARVIEANEASVVDKNRNEYLSALDLFLARARAANWTLPQRDELIRLCDDSFDWKRGIYRVSLSHMVEKVKELADEVRSFRKAKQDATEQNLELPDEMATSWAWAISGVEEWDPAQESWREYLGRKGNESHASLDANGTLPSQQESKPTNQTRQWYEDTGVQAEPF